ncbi:MAG: Swt1 family HEPN domain-containing protein [Dehalococcoidia bacterium]
MTTASEAIRLFAINNQMLELDLDRVERHLGLELGREGRAAPADDVYYPQIEASIRTEAAAMAPHYEVFYSLENTIRRQIVDTLAATGEADWWVKRVPQAVRDEAEKRHKLEVDSGNTVRSTDLMDFTTFGELGEIIKSNWDLFGSLFSSQPAVAAVMRKLNQLRGPIAHCSPLAEDEVVRLRLTVKDWFRLME